MIVIAASALLSLPLAAQETYENAKLIGDDLNGTARYVGMGGAMEALGADISTISTNPAGIGLFRGSMVSGSVGMISQQDAESFACGNKTNASIDQLGAVFSMRQSPSSYLNFAINYRKSNNFNQILSAADQVSGASQNKLSYIKGYEGLFDIRQTSGGGYTGYDPAGGYSARFNQLDYLYYNTLLAPDADGNIYYNDASDYTLNRANTGYIGEYGFNVSGNCNNRFYWGVTFDLYDVHYKGESAYMETLVDGNGDYAGAVAVEDVRKITGTGFSVKGGIIFRPVEESPFRVGLYVHIPTWYDLETRNETCLSTSGDLLTDISSTVNPGSGSIGESYEFKFRTPWKFGLSLGHTVGNYLALGATYEFSDYGGSDIRINDGGYYDEYWGTYYESSSSDEVMNDHMKETLKAVSTLKLGAEFKPVENVAVRLGYNYVSPAYSKTGFKDGSLNSYGTYYASSTDYTNWKSTNRITAGVGFTYQKWNFDLAYQYSQTNGDFSPYMSYYPATGDDQSLKNDAGSVEVSNKRNQLLLTVGYRF